MKNFYFLFFLLPIIICNRSSAQENQNNPELKNFYDKECGSCKDPDVLIYDFKCKHFFYKNEWVKDLKQVSGKHNQEFKVKVININKYLYNINFSVDNIEFGSEAPTVFKQLFLGDGSFATGLIDKGSASPEGLRANEYESEFISALRAFSKTYNRLSGNYLKVNELCNTNFNCCESQESFYELSNKLLDLKIKLGMYKAELSRHTDELKGKIESKKEGHKACVDILANAATSRTNRVKCEKLTEAYDAMVAENTATDLLRLEMEKIWVSIESISSEDLMKLVLFNNNMRTDHFHYTSPPIYPSGNKLSIGLKFSPADSSLSKKWNIMPLHSDSMRIDFFVKDKWFVHFSSGPFVGLGSSLAHRKYGWKPQLDTNGLISDSSKYKLVSESKTSAPLGIAGFVHIGTKFTNNFGLGFSTGAGITIEEKPRTVYFLGGSAFFGEKHQLNLTTGIALAQVKELNPNIYTDIPNTVYAKPATSIEYQNTVKASAFLSLSYTIFSFARSTASGTY